MFIVDSFFVVFVFPLLLCFAAFSHQLEGADPSSYPRVAAPRPSLPGDATCAAVWTRPFGIHFSLLCVWQRVTGTPGTIFGGEGAHIAPSGPIFHTHVSVPAPGFFFFFFVFWPLGPAAPWIARRNGRSH